MALRSCSSCGHEELEPGFLTDTGARPGYGRWVPGKLETGALGGAKLFGKDRIEVKAFRCTKCKHLELFANDGPPFF